MNTVDRSTVEISQTTMENLLYGLSSHDLNEYFRDDAKALRSDVRFKDIIEYRATPWLPPYFPLGKDMKRVSSWIMNSFDHIFLKENGGLYQTFKDVALKIPMTDVFGYTVKPGRYSLTVKSEGIGKKFIVYIVLEKDEKITVVKINENGYMFDSFFKTHVLIEDIDTYGEMMKYFFGKSVELRNAFRGSQVEITLEWYGKDVTMKHRLLVPDPDVDNKIQYYDDKGNTLFLPRKQKKVQVSVNVPIFKGSDSDLSNEEICRVLTEKRSMFFFTFTNKDSHEISLINHPEGTRFIDDISWV